MASLLAALLFAASEAHAGTYFWTTTNPTTGGVIAQSPSFSGGSVIVKSSLTLIGSRRPPPPAFSASSGYYTGGGGCVTTSTVYSGAPCGGPTPCSVMANSPASPIVATFTWQPASGQTSATDPPPPAVIVEQDCTATWAANEVDGTATTTGTADCGLPSASVSTSTNASGTVTGVSSSGTQYSAVTSPGASFSIPAQSSGSYKPTASFTVSSGTSGAGNGGASVSYHVQAFPVTLNLGGATRDSSGNYDILIGQTCTASLSGIPTTCTASNYQWSVSGSTFQSWTADQTHTTEVDGLGLTTNPTASWFWDDLKTASDTVKCSANVTPPSGQGSPFSITVTQPVNVVVPGWTCVGNGGTMQVITLSGSSDYDLIAGPASGSTTGRGMDWTATLSSLPAPFSGTGALELVQTETPNSTYTSLAGINYNRSNNGQQGLDSSYPYGWDSTASPPNYETGDSPFVDLSSLSAASAQLKYSFVDTLMFEPPNSTQYVPLGAFTWSTNGNAQIPASKNWADYGSGSAGAITPSGPGNKFTPSIAFPSWAQNVGNGTWTWVAAH